MSNKKDHTEPIIIVGNAGKGKGFPDIQLNNRKCQHQDYILDCHVPNEIPECYKDCKFYKPNKD